MTKDATYEGEREVKTFVDLFHGSKVLIDKSKSVKEGSYFTTMGSLLLTAFTFEAFLNHLGHKKIKFWNKIDRISINSKYTVLCEEFELELDHSERPYQTIKQLFRFRNSIAHGRSEILKVNKRVSSKDDPWQHAPKTDWEEFCTESNAEKAREDIEIIIKELNEAAGLGDYPFISGMTISSIRV